MRLHNKDTAYLCNADLFLLVGTKCKQWASKCRDFTDPAWTLATELQWHPALCQNKRWHHSWSASEWDLNSGLNVAAWSVCATDAQDPLLCYCLFVYVFLQLLSLVSQRLIILSGASQNQFPVSLCFCWFPFLLKHNFLCWNNSVAALFSFRLVIWSVWNGLIFSQRYWQWGLVTKLLW